MSFLNKREFYLNETSIEQQMCQSLNIFLYERSPRQPRYWNPSKNSFWEFYSSNIKCRWLHWYLFFGWNDKTLIKKTVTCVHRCKWVG